MALPHIRNSKAGVNRWDPVHVNIFEVAFSLPEAIRSDFGSDEALISEHVTNVSGLDALGRAPEVGQQKFMGTDRSYINPKLDSTHAEISIGFTLNLRDDTDDYVYKLLRAWAALGYNINTGERALKRQYVADWFKVSVANRDGQIFHQIVFKDMMMNGALEGYNELNYDTNEPASITAKFVSDWWDETMA